MEPRRGFQAALASFSPTVTSKTDIRKRFVARKADGGGSRGSYSSYGSGGGGGGAREMFSATCSSCGKEAQVPFQPSGDKPVYCSECFQQRGGGNRSGARGRN